MAWLGQLAGKAEALLNKVDAAAGTALKNEDGTDIYPVTTAGGNVGGTGGVYTPYLGSPPATTSSTLSGSSSAISSSSSVPSNLNKMNTSDPNAMTRSMYSTSDFSAKPKAKGNSDDDLFDFLNSSDPVEPKKKTPVSRAVSSTSHSRHSSTSSTTSARSTKTPEPHFTLTDKEDSPAPPQPENTVDPDVPAQPAMERELMLGSSQSSKATAGVSDDQDQRLSGLQLENDLLKQEVSSLNQEMNSVIKRAKSSQEELAQMKRQYEQANYQMSKQDQIVRELRSRESDFHEALGAKDSQLAILRVRFDESDKELGEKRKQLESVQSERNRILHDHTSATDVQGQAFDSLKLKLTEAEACLRQEQEAHRKTQQEANERFARLESEQKKMAEEMASMQKKMTEERARHSESNMQMSTAKSQAESAKLELVNYKEKATRILQSKDKLIASLKDGSGASGPDSLVANMELENIKQERDLLREELQQSQSTLEQLRLEISELEVAMSQDNESNQENLQSLEDQLRSEKSRREDADLEVSRQKQELRFAHEELVKQKTGLQSRIHDRESEIERLRNQLTAKSASSTSQTELENRLHALTESLIQKQTMLEALGTEKNSLVLQLERIEKQYREAEAAAVRASAASVVMHDDEDTSTRQRLPTFMRESAMDGDVTRRVKRAANSIDKFSIRLGVFLKRYPIARVFVILYMIMLHVWVMVVLLTYQPEIHGHDYSPVEPRSP